MSIIPEIKELLRERGRISLAELAIHFSMEPDAIRPILELLVRKGHAAVVEIGCAKGGCKGCACARREEMLLFERREDAP
jgi:hypothetical protein